MLPQYKAIAIDQEAIQAGSTKPCLMAVKNQNGQIVGNYVVKIFKPSNLEQGRNTNKEVYCNVLAREFDLAVPEAALIYVKKELIDQLNISPRYQNFNLIPGYYFGSLYIENTLDFSDAVRFKIESWEIENIFAFDVLIRKENRIYF